MKTASPRPWRQARIVFQAFALQAFGAEIMAGTGGIGILLRPGIPAGGRRDRHHRNAVDRAGRHAQVATRAQVGDDRVHLFRRAQDGVDGACLDAQRTADAQAFVDDGDRARRPKPLDPSILNERLVTARWSI